MSGSYDPVHMTSVRLQHADVPFMAVTTPLSARQGGAGGWVKSQAGNPMCQLMLHVTVGPRCVNVCEHAYAGLQRCVRAAPASSVVLDSQTKPPGPLTRDYLQRGQQHTPLSNT